MVIHTELAAFAPWPCRSGPSFHDKKYRVAGLDAFDLRIFTALQRDARTPVTEPA